MNIINVPARKYTVGNYYKLKAGFPDEYTIYENALFRGEDNEELIFWEGGTNDGLIVLLHCHILEASEK